MTVVGLDHINIRTMDVAASAQFYVDLLDFEFRNGPGFMGGQANWLYDKSGNPIIHLRVLEPEGETTGSIDHVALKCRGKAEIVQRLTERDIPFSMSENPGLTQIFVRDPHGVMLELNFSGE